MRERRRESGRESGRERGRGERGGEREGGREGRERGGERGRERKFIFVNHFFGSIELDYGGNFQFLYFAPTSRWWLITVPKNIHEKFTQF